MGKKREEVPPKSPHDTSIERDTWNGTGLRVGQTSEDIIVCGSEEPASGQRVEKEVKSHTEPLTPTPP